MASLIFIATFLFVVVFAIKICIKSIQHKNIVTNVRTVLAVLIAYSALWSGCYFFSNNKTVPFGTDVCFDDWCATVTKAERLPALGTVYPKGQFILLHITLSNHAKGIAQKPSEPGVHIINEKGQSWAISKEGQQAFNTLYGQQIPIDERLELHQSLQTVLVFDIPNGAKHLEALIEEGPFITKLLPKGDNEVFLIEQ